MTTLLQERKQLLQDAIRFKKTDRIPTVSNYWTYIVLHENMELNDALYDYDLLYKALCNFHEKYDFDSYIYTGTRNPFKVTEPLGANWYVIDNATGHINMDDHVFMEADEYPELIKDPVKFIWEHVMARKCRAGEEPDAFERLVESAKEYNAFGEFIGRFNKQLVEVYGVPKRTSGASYLTSPFDHLFNYFRGIKGTSIDIRRNLSMVKEACLAMEELAGVNAFFAEFDKPLPEDTVFGAGTGLLGHTILSPKQFGELYYPLIKKAIDKCVETDRIFNIFSEGTFGRFYEFFQDVPKGTITVQIEEDSVFEVRKKLPNVCISGGMTTDYLGGKSKEECIDLAKRLVDEIGPDGGLLLSQNKMMSYRNDAKPENILAIQEFARTYRG